MASNAKILIVGAGPTGLSLAIMLRQRGYAPEVVERRVNLDGLPAAHVINTRSLEVLAGMGLAEQVNSAGDPFAHDVPITWVESMVGRQYGILPVSCEAKDPRGPVSALHSVNLAQNRFELLLAAHHETLGGKVRFGEEVVKVADTADGATVTLRSGAGPERQEQYDWIIGCDGAGSTVRRTVGLEMVGPRTIEHFLTIYFSADLDKQREGRRGVLYWIGGMDARGVFINFDKEGRTFAMLVPIGPLTLDLFDEEAARGIIRKALGTTDIPFDIIGVSEWNMSAQVANGYRAGHVILAGDSCHRFPPTGGLGLNTGLQDAQNLVWKLTAIIEGRAPQSLLDSYQIERQPIAQFNCNLSVSNFIKMGMIDEQIGIRTLAPIAADAPLGPPKAFAPGTLLIDGDSPEAVARRAAVQAAIDDQQEHFAQGAGTDLGFSYTADTIIADGSPPPSSRPIDYRPDAHPGARLPHAAADGSYANSTLGKVQPDGLTLFVRDGSWADIAAQAVIAAGGKILVHVVLADSATFGPAITDLLGINAGGAVAVRPDGHVMWRSRDLPADPVGSLAHAIRVSHGLAS